MPFQQSFFTYKKISTLYILFLLFICDLNMLVYTSLSPNHLSSHLLPPPVMSFLPVSHTRLLSYSGLVGIEGGRW